MISAISAEGLWLDRGGRRLLGGLNFDVRAGEALALTGPNGAGQTSLLRCLAGLLRPSAGAVTFTGPDGSLDPATARAAGLHWLGAQDGLKGQRSAQAELRFWARWAGGSDKGADAALEALGLADRANDETRRLSSGQRRRLALARLLATPRSLWLLDEPLGPLDAAWRTRLGELMAAHLAAGGLIVAAVHDPLPAPARELAVGGAS